MITPTGSMTDEALTDRGQPLSRGLQTQRKEKRGSGPTMLGNPCRTHLLQLPPPPPSRGGKSTKSSAAGRHRVPTRETGAAGPRPPSRLPLGMAVLETTPRNRDPVASETTAVVATTTPSARGRARVGGQGYLEGDLVLVLLLFPYTVLEYRAAEMAGRVAALTVTVHSTVCCRSSASSSRINTPEGRACPCVRSRRGGRGRRRGG